MLQSQGCLSYVQSLCPIHPVSRPVGHCASWSVVLFAVESDSRSLIPHASSAVPKAITAWGISRTRRKQNAPFRWNDVWGTSAEKKSLWMNASCGNAATRSRNSAGFGARDMTAKRTCRCAFQSAHAHHSAVPDSSRDEHAGVYPTRLP